MLKLRSLNSINQNTSLETVFNYFFFLFHVHTPLQKERETKKERREKKAGKTATRSEKLKTEENEIMRRKMTLTQK